MDTSDRHDMRLTAPSLAAIELDRPEPEATKTRGLCMNMGYEVRKARSLVAE